jgi:glutamate-5-semialdehyde dehydrogenase
MDMPVPTAPLSDAEANALIGAMGARARAVATLLAATPTARKAYALRHAARLLRERADAVLAANAEDIARADASGMAAAMKDRLTLTPTRLDGVAESLDAVAGLDDPVGQVIDRRTPPNGLDLRRVRVPLGVVGIIYESRPNVTADAGALALMAGNAAILRGGSEARASNAAIHAALADGIEAAGLPRDAVQLIPTPDRAAVGALLRAQGLVDIIVPRGGKGLVARVQAEARVPVLAHLDGRC